MEEKMNVSQWGFQWDDPIDWNKLNYQTSVNGRKFIRHPSGMGTVMSMNDGTNRNILVLDAQYRSHGYLSLEMYSGNNHCRNVGLIDGTRKTLPFSGWSDETLNPWITNQDVYTSKENTDYMMSMNSDVQYLAGYCHSKTISHNSIIVGCDAPNINTLIRIYAEMIQLDSMDPTVSSYSDYSLSMWFPGAKHHCWSSSLGSFSSYGPTSCAFHMYSNSNIDYRHDVVSYGFTPVLEL